MVPVVKWHHAIRCWCSDQGKLRLSAELYAVIQFIKILVLYAIPDIHRVDNNQCSCFSNLDMT